MNQVPGSSPDGNGAPGRWLAALVLIGLIATSLAGWLAAKRTAQRVTAPAALASAVDHVRQGFRDGDAVLVRPTWETGAWHALEGIGAGTVKAPWPAMMRGDWLDLVDLLQHQRVWVIAAHGREPSIPLDNAAVLPSGSPLATFGTASVAVWNLTHTPSLARLSQDAEHLQVERRPEKGEPIACRRTGVRFRCGLKPWYDVRPETRDVFHRDVRWLYTHPNRGQERLSLRWELPEGTRWVIVRTGWAQWATRRAEGAPTHVEITAGAVRTEILLEPWTYTQGQRLIEVTADVREVELVIWTTDASFRELLTEADAYADVPQALQTWLSEPLRFHR